MNSTVKVRTFVIEHKKLLKTVVILFCCAVFLLVFFRTRDFINVKRDAVRFAYIMHRETVMRTEFTEILDEDAVADILENMVVCRSLDIPPYYIKPNYEEWMIDLYIGNDHRGWLIILGDHYSYARHGEGLYHMVKNPEEIMQALSELAGLE